MVALHKAPPCYLASQRPHIWVCWNPLQNLDTSSKILLQHKCFCFCFQATTKNYKSGYTNWKEVAHIGLVSSRSRRKWTLAERSKCSFQCKSTESDPRLRLDQTHTSSLLRPPSNSLNVLFLAVSYGTEELMVKSDQPSLQGWRMKWIGGWAQ